ncbi:hypothetical protein MPSEU_000630800 [Mayamaea pseudoterrestris]|nr:hypothetical protein MPSEU_000630800 [Mayamaea pseudoterrestris]
MNQKTGSSRVDTNALNEALENTMQHQNNQGTAAAESNSVVGAQQPVQPDLPQWQPSPDRPANSSFDQPTANPEPIQLQAAGHGDALNLQQQHHFPPLPSLPLESQTDAGHLHLSLHPPLQLSETQSSALHGQYSQMAQSLLQNDMLNFPPGAAVSNTAALPTTQPAASLDQVQHQYPQQVFMSLPAGFAQLQNNFNQALQQQGAFMMQQQYPMATSGWPHAVSASLPPSDPAPSAHLQQQQEQSRQNLWVPPTSTTTACNAVNESTGVPQTIEFSSGGGAGNNFGSTSNGDTLSRNSRWQLSSGSSSSLGPPPAGQQQQQQQQQQLLPTVFPMQATPNNSLPPVHQDALSGLMHLDPQLLAQNPLLLQQYMMLAGLLPQQYVPQQDFSIPLQQPEQSSQEYLLASFQSQQMQSPLEQPNFVAAGAQMQVPSWLTALASNQPQLHGPPLMEPPLVASSRRRSRGASSQVTGAVDENVGSLQVRLRQRRRYRHESFPSKLYRILEEVERDGSSDIVSFTAGGTAFTIHNTSKFTSQILPKYFRHGRMSSFKRQLSMYGFHRYTSGPEEGAFHHELFRKGRPDLCLQLKRVTEFEIVPAAAATAAPLANPAAPLHHQNYQVAGSMDGNDSNDTSAIQSSSIREGQVEPNATSGGREQKDV